MKLLKILITIILAVLIIIISFFWFLLIMFEPLPFFITFIVVIIALLLIKKYDPDAFKCNEPLEYTFEETENEYKMDDKLEKTKNSKSCNHNRTKSIDQVIITTWECIDCGETYKIEHGNPEPSPPPEELTVKNFLEYHNYSEEALRHVLMNGNKNEYTIDDKLEEESKTNNI